MAKKITPLSPDYEDAQAERAKSLPVMKELINLANAFQSSRDGRHFEVDVPIMTAVKTIEGYRRENIPAGTVLAPDEVFIGKRNGLIFRFRFVTPSSRKGVALTHAEMSWDDLSASMPALHSALNNAYKGDATAHVKQADAQIKAAVKANPGMHGILSKGFQRAQEHSREINKEHLEDHPLFGAF